MATALNMTMPLKQDPESQRKLGELKKNFATTLQDRIDSALRRSELVHFARVLVVGKGEGEYIQVLTEFDGDALAYTEFFRLELPEVFQHIFSLVEGVPDWSELNTPNTFYKYSSQFNVAALGRAADPDDAGGYLFSAYGNKRVQEIQAKLQV